MNEKYEYPKVLVELADHATTVLKRHGLDEAKAREISAELAEHIRTTLGGQPVYITKGRMWAAHQKWQAIWAEFTGDNHETLATKHGVTLRHVYDVVAAMRAEEVKRRQSDMFPEPG